MDGVVTDTASLHAAAWKELFDEILADPRIVGSRQKLPFDLIEDYRKYLDGRTREDGVTAFLGARGLELPFGNEQDSPDSWTICGLASHKNAIFLKLLVEHGVRVFPGTTEFLRRLKRGRIQLGLVTASRNARAVLEPAGLAKVFDVIIDGTLSASLALPGKPNPATFLEAARRLGLTPDRVAVVEDSVVGIRAAVNGHFGLVVGINRDDRREDLEGAGANLVVEDLGELDLGVSRSDPWRLVYKGFDPAHEAQREALTTLGNGYMATRGANSEHSADGIHYPGTYIAGVYNRLVSTIDGHDREDEDLVNIPNWLVFDLRIGDGTWWSQGGFGAANESRELDLRRGFLTRSVLLTDESKRSIHLTERRVVSMDRPHLAALQTTLVANGWSGSIWIRTGCDPSVTNGNCPESPELANRHLVLRTSEQIGDVQILEVETSQSAIRIAAAIRTTVLGASAVADHHDDGDGAISTRFAIELTDDRPVVIEKFVAIATSRDSAIASPRDGALCELQRVDFGFDDLLRRQSVSWKRLWEHYEVDIDADDQTKLSLNLHIFHLLQVISPHVAELDIGVPARGLHGEGYRGHVFWDELFVLPLFTLRTPAIARALLDYRWRRLDAARHIARTAGLYGAMFPWQSGSDGREETPLQLFNPRSQRWIADNSRRQVHVGLAVAFNAWQYYQVTKDLPWLAEHGAELLVEVARLFAGLAVYESSDDRFHISGVMGPDEYHDGYPDAPGLGLLDNAYTNVLAAWVCRHAAEALSLLPDHERDELQERLRVCPRELEQWNLLGRRVAVPFHDGIISQFSGYERLEELDWTHYRATYGDIGRLDLILEAENDTTNQYRLSKQADVLMLIYLLGAEELTDELSMLGYTVTRNDLERTVDYYLARTAHGSTLSRVVHASVLASFGRPSAWNEFREALDADIDDTQGGTTGRGIHLGAMAGSIDIVLRTFGGIRTDSNALVFSPKLPRQIDRAKFEIRYRGQRIGVNLDHRNLRLAARPSGSDPVLVKVNGVSVQLVGGEVLDFPIDRDELKGVASIPATSKKYHRNSIKA